MKLHLYGPYFLLWCLFLFSCGQDYHKKTNLVSSNTKPNTLSITNSSKPTNSTKKTVDQGWNLISFPITQTTTIEAYLQIQVHASSIRSIWQWDTNLNEMGNWRVYPQTGDFAILSEITPTEGYWILSKGTFELTGTSIAQEAYSFQAGWNLIGYNQASSKSVGDFFSQGNFWSNACGTGDTVLNVWAWQDQSWKVFFPDDKDRISFNTTYNTAFEALTTLEPGMGIWVRSLRGNTTPNNGICSVIPIQITAGGTHTCTLLSNGTIQCWGDGAFGQLGNGSTSNQNTPASVLEINNAKQIAAGGGHTCALLDDNTIQCWGYGKYGQLGNNSISSQDTPVSVQNINTAVQISAGGDHTCAVLSGGSVKCWGYGYYGRLGDGNYGLNSFQRSPVSIQGIDNATQVTAGEDHTCALLTDGTAKCWGSGLNGRLGNGSTAQKTYPATVSGINMLSQIVAGGDHTCALMEDHSSYCWGQGSHGQLGNGTLEDQATPTTTNTNSAIQLAVGNHHTCAVLKDYSLKCWGRGVHGQLGNRRTADQAIPVSTNSTNTAIKITTGYHHTCALFSDHSLQCWGFNDFGQLGNGQSTHQLMPTPVIGLQL